MHFVSPTPSTPFAATAVEEAATTLLTSRGQLRLRLRLDAVHADIHLRVLELSRPHVRNALLNDLVQVARQQMLLRLTVL